MAQLMGRWKIFDDSLIIFDDILIIIDNILYSVDVADGRTD